MKLSVKATQKSAKTGKAEIDKRKKDLAIRKCFMFSDPLRRRSWRMKTDLEAGSSDINHAPKDEEDQSANRTPSKESGKSAKRKREQCNSGPRSPKGPKPTANSVGDHKPGPSGAWTSSISSDPLILVLKKAGPSNAKPEDQHRPTEKYEPTNMDWLYDDVSRLPLDAPIPDPDLSFLEK